MSDKGIFWTGLLISVAIGLYGDHLLANHSPVPYVAVYTRCEGGGSVWRGDDGKHQLLIETFHCDQGDVQVTSDLGPVAPPETK